MPNVSVNISLGGKLAAFKSMIEKGGDVMQVIFQRWTVTYSQYLSQRFDKMAGGGSGEDPKDGVTVGPWDRLAPSTLGGHSRRNLLILVRSGLLRDTVRAGMNMRGAVTSNGEGHYEAGVAFNTNHTYPKGNTTTLDVISAHQIGSSRLPQRKIVAQVDERTRQQMANQAKEIILQRVNSSSGGGGDVEEYEVGEVAEAEVGEGLAAEIAEIAEVAILL